jgi:hypothetical protein
VPIARIARLTTYVARPRRLAVLTTLSLLGGLATLGFAPAEGHVAAPKATAPVSSADAAEAAGSPEWQDNGDRQVDTAPDLDGTEHAQGVEASGDIIVHGPNQPAAGRSLTTTTTKPPATTTTTTKPPDASTHQRQLVVETGGGTATTTTTAPPTTTTTAPPTTTTTTAPSGGGTLPSGCNAVLSVRMATANALGYLFGDGHWGSSGYNYAARDSCKLARMKNDLNTIGVHYTLSTNHFTIAPVAPFDKPQDFGVSPWMATASSDEIKAFLAGDLEGEGSGSGKVFDDPGWGRTSGIVDTYQRINVVVKPDHPAPTCGCETDGTYWNTYVDPSASTSVYNGYITIINSFPFAETGRVPNYR